MAARIKFDWEVIHKEYRSGTYSVGELARRHGCSRGAIQKQVKKNGWEQDLTEAVRRATNAKMVAYDAKVAEKEAGKVAATNAEDAIEAAATTRIAVVHSHRKDIAQGRSLVGLLFSQLDEAAQNRADIENQIAEDAINEETGKSDYRRKAMMLRAVSLPGHAGVLRDLSTALKNLIPLERQAFNIGDEDPRDNDATAEFTDTERAARLAALLAMVPDERDDG